MVGRELHTLVCPLGEDHQGQGERVWGGMGYRMEPGCRSWATAMEMSILKSVCVAKGACFSIRSCRRGRQEELFPMMHCTTMALIQGGIPGGESITIVLLMGWAMKTTTMVHDLIQTTTSSLFSAPSTASALPARAASPMSISRTRNSTPWRARACSNFPSRRIPRLHVPLPRAAAATTTAPAAAPARRNRIPGPRSSHPRRARPAPARENRIASAATAPLTTPRPHPLHRHQAFAFPAQARLHSATRHIRPLAQTRGARADPTPPSRAAKGEIRSTMPPFATTCAPAAATQSALRLLRKPNTSPAAQTVRVQVRVPQATRSRRTQPTRLSASGADPAMLTRSCIRRVARHPLCTRAAAPPRAPVASAVPCQGLLPVYRMAAKASTLRFHAVCPCQ